MATIRKFEELDIWKEARKLSHEIFLITGTGDWSKDYKFRDQIRLAAGSVMDNIAEGFERSSRLEFVNFLSIAKGSAGEVRSQLYRAQDQKYISDEQSEILRVAFDKLSAAIAGFIIYLNQTEVKGQKFKDRQ